MAQPVGDVKWTGQVGQSKWSANRWFGKQAHQTYRVLVIAITSKALKKILAAHEPDTPAWHDSKLPPRKVAEVVALRDVRQIPGPHNC